MPKISVVVPICNVEKYLRQCLDSIANQTLQDLEVILVNDGSKDSSGEICDDYVAKDSRFSVIHKPNSGYGHSMNVGFDAAQGEYIGIVESDDYIDYEMYEHLYNTAVKYDVEVVKSNFFLYWSAIEDDNQFEPVVPYKHCGKVFCPAKDLKGMEQVAFWNAKPSIWSSIYKRDFIRKNNIRFNETPGASYQDASFSFKVWTCAQKVYCLYSAYLHYRQDNANSSVNTSGKVYCICDEYDEMERFINEDPKRAYLYPLMNRIRFDSYMWNMDRIAPEFVPEFAKRMSEDFSAAAKKGGINKLMFEPWKWETLKLVSSTPGEFVRQYLRDRQSAGVNAKIDELRSQLNAQANLLNRIVDGGINTMGLFGRLKKKIRTALFILQHEGVGGVMRTIRAKLRL